MDFFFNDNIDPSEMAGLLIGAIRDFLPTGNADTDTYIERVIQSYNAAGGLASFSGDAVDKCEDIEIALQMILAQTDDQDVKEMAQMNLMALEEARLSWGESAGSLGFEDEEPEMVSLDQLDSSRF